MTNANYVFQIEYVGQNIVLVLWEYKHWMHSQLTYWDPMTYVCVSKLTTISSDDALSSGRRQVIIWTNDGIMLTLGTNSVKS